ncbi:hypothetical protein M5K25_022885 [Dendrobium thyrsiflorum]|uniref:Uncharacterized protein n=1 Tax=Dendrobium thyrsiflorum TaxID=117978 RepID=A0ABD0UDE4_DENTH
MEIIESSLRGKLKVLFQALLCYDSGKRQRAKHCATLSDKLNFSQKFLLSGTSTSIYLLFQELPDPLQLLSRNFSQKFLLSGTSTSIYLLFKELPDPLQLLSRFLPIYRPAVLNLSAGYSAVQPAGRTQFAVQKDFSKILQSSFFDIDPEVDHTVNEYIARILDIVALAVEDQLGTVEWRLATDPKLGQILSYQSKHAGRQIAAF